MKPICVLLCCLLSGSLLCAQSLRVAFVGDPQVDDEIELGYARASIYRELRERTDLDLVILLGDLVNDDVKLLAPTKASLDSLPCPWFSVPGNHDRDLYGRKKGRVMSLDGTVDEGRPRDMASYTKIIGTPDTTFIRSGIRFILMDDVRRQGAMHYEGGWREDQKRWLQAVLEDTPPDMPAVLAAHIPFQEFAARDSLQAILSVHPKLLQMCGHTHTTGRFTREVAGRPVEEVLAGAACGTFWRGPRNAAGIPDALMNCGAPRGYYVADLSKDGYRLSYKAVQRPDVASAWTDGTGRMVLNVYGGSTEGRVEVRFKGSRGWVAVPRREEVAPEVRLGVARNKALKTDGPRTRHPDYIPLLTQKSPHVWAATLQKVPAPGERLRIRYRDPHLSFRRTVTVQALPD